MLQRIKDKKLVLFFLMLPVPLILHRPCFAMEDADIIKILSQNPELFKKNGIVDGAFRFIGWGITKGIAALADVCSELYDTCFGLIDFTNFKPVNDFINEWKPVFIALVCLSLLLIGILLCVGWEKKPKLAINLLIAVTVVSSGSYVLNKMNTFIGTEVRSEILGGQSSSVVYGTIGNNIHDLKWLEQTAGLENLNKKDKGKKNAGKVYPSFSKKQFKNLDIQEILDPDDFDGAAGEILNVGLEEATDGKNKISYSLEDLYDGVAWTDLLNEFYYRYTVDYGVMWMELLSLIIIYLFMSYKVVRTLYEIVIHELLAYLYSANLNNNQKILKIIDSFKDSYILLLMTTVMIKFYLLATKYISSWEINGIAKGLILLFLAFAVIDGPNLIQKLTGADIGASDGMGKVMSLFYGGRMVAGAAGAAGGAVVRGAKGAKSGASSVFSKIKDAAGKKDIEDEIAGVNGVAVGKGHPDGEDRTDHTSNPQNNQSNDSSTHQQEKTDINQENNQNSHAEIQENTGDVFSAPDGGRESDYAGADTFGEPEEETPVPGVDKSEGAEKGKGTVLAPEHEKQGMGNMQNDKLNGFAAGNGYGGRGNDMKQMEQDLSGNTHPALSEDIKSNTPIDAGGKIFGKVSSEDSIRQMTPEGKIREEDKAL